jgi:glycosyltransferase involved in cell wall biosynthesis
MHILILADSVDNQNAGIHVYTKNLIKALLKTDKKNEYSFIHCKENTFFKNTKNYIIPQKKGFGMESYRKFFKIPKLIKTIKPDVVFEPCHIGPFRLPNSIKKVVTIHDLTPIIFPKFHIKRSTIIHKLLLKKSLKNADLIITPSKNTKKDLIKKYNLKNKIKTIPLGIENKSTNKELTGKNLKNAKYILYLGTIEPRKNLTTLIDAFTELKKKEDIPHKLIISGPIGWKYKEILKKTNNPNIILTGYVSEREKSALYENADIFVYPSIYEGFGLPPLEALSHGTPVICSNGGSLKEIFQNHALIFEPKDKEKLKQHIKTLTHDEKLKKKLIEKGLKYALNFTWEKTAKKTIEEIEKLK